MQQELQKYMRECLGLAQTALETGNPPVGALLVFENKVIGTGIESGRSTGDITNHAEIVAIRAAIKNGYADQIHLACMYTTHEPCIMCSYLIRHHRIAEIVYGTSVPFVGGATSQFSILLTEEVPKWSHAPRITSGICLEECLALNEQFQNKLNRP